MDKNAIKKYAIWARRELIMRVSQKALQYGISESGGGYTAAEIINGIANGKVLSDAENRQRHTLIKKIQERGYEQVMEEVAYTWFNRFCALRFMEVNGYLPTHVRVFTDEANQFKSQILAEAIHLDLDGLNMDRVYELKDANKTEELYKYLLIVQCNALSAILPHMFQKIEDYTELLLPDYLLREGSVIEQMIALIPEEDWADQVQIIGWLYQYYNTEPKDAVFAALKKNIKISKENIPAATQLFTPDWIVRYMVENSLGRLWLEGHPNDSLKSEWKYYLDEAEQEEDVRKQLDEIRKEYAQLKPEDIRCIDPCMGSGHILCYMFDVLVRIYEDYGYTAREAVGNIVEKNLWGLDIDERAAQLSYFAVMMKARQYDRRFFGRNIQPNVYSPQGYAEGEEFGSLLMVDELEPMPQEEGQLTLFDESRMNRWNFRRALAQKYHVVCTNPPYMGISNGDARLNEFVKKCYPDSKADMFAVFIERCGEIIKKNGLQAMITQHAWMFLSSFEKLREKLQMTDIVNMAHLGARAFDEIGGEVVQTTSFVMRKSHLKWYKGTYCRLIEPTTQTGKEEMLLAGTNRYVAVQDNFEKIPGSPVAYWASDEILSLFRKSPLLNSVHFKEGITTGDNDKFLRLWHEVSFDSIVFGKTEGIEKITYWRPCNKGGVFRRWYGNRYYVIDWTGHGEKLHKFKGSSFRNAEFQLCEGGTFSNLSSGAFSTRYTEKGFAFESKGTMFFSAELQQIIAYMNTKLFNYLLKFVCPTLDYKFGTVQKLPLLHGNGCEKQLSNDCISLSRKDWDSFETSWDFMRHPLVVNVHKSRECSNGGAWQGYIKDAYFEWKNDCEMRFQQLKSNEEELNRIFIDIYGLQDELTPEVEDKDVTVRKADLQRDIKSLISYAVGCMFGRYSLDMPGLAYAGGEWDATRYTTFQPDKDAIIPISDDEYFEDDIVKRFEDFIRIVYGAETLNDNMKFIADALGGKGQPREVIRNYFLNDFFADHCKIYQKRPIYWLFDSGKKNGFKCLIYMHRYQPDTIARIRTDYVHEQQSRYRTAMEDLEKRIAGATASERIKLNKQLTALQAQATEIREYEEKIHHLADQMIHIDLDDGVKVNYAKFQDVLAKIK